MIRLIPFLWFSDRAEDAARLYASIIPDSRIDRVWTMASEGDPPDGTRVVEFTLAGSPVAIMQAAGGTPLNMAISLMIECDDQDQIDAIWDGLLDGGTALQCGWLTDRYGVSWQVTPRRLLEMQTSPDRAAAARAAQAMMGMVKLDIVALEAAFAG